MMRSPLRGLAASAVVAAFSPAAQAALDVAGIDKTVDACTSFYQYANKSWLATTEIPADRARLGAFEIIDQRNEQLLLEAIDNEIRTAFRGKKYARGTPEWMAIEYYQSGMNTNRIEYHSYRGLLPMLERAKAAANPAEIASNLAYLHGLGIRAGFTYSVDPDRKDSTRYLMEISQGGLGLPDRDYYFLDDERSKLLREGYRKHMRRMFEMLEDSPEAAARNADKVIALETELAKVSMTATDRRDVDKTYNRMTVAQLSEAAPGFPWRDYFDSLGARGIADLNVSQPEFFKAIARLANDKSVDWTNYLRWQVVNAAATKLPRRFDDENFDFFERQFKGVKTPPPRHRKVLRIIGGPYGSEGVGMALGKIFVDENFPPDAKKRALDLVNNVKAALHDRLKAASWMTEETRKRSLEKLATMQVKIGYPDQWRSYTGAGIGIGKFLENWLASNTFDHRRDINRIGKPVDRGDWLISPHVVNAYYNPAANEIVFPAAILQPPYFDARADDALNYGGIGMVIGHEITHGFDNRGRRYDKDGNLRDWWTPEDEARFNERAKVIEAQYSAMEPVEGVKPNGTLTLGENISDVGGMKIAYDGLQKAMKGKPPVKIDGLTADQRFFLSFAQAWRSKARPEYERNAVLTGQHSLPRFRVAGPIAHMPEFARAFSCDASKALLPGIAGNAIW